MEAAMRVESNEDLLLEVLKHLDGKSLAISACVSRQWKRAAETESLWENICARNWHFGQLYSRQLRSVVPAMGGYRRLYLISRPLRATERNGNDDDNNNNNNNKKKKNYGQRSENRLSCRPRCSKDEVNFSLSLLSIDCYERLGNLGPASSLSFLCKPSAHDQARRISEEVQCCRIDQSV